MSLVEETILFGSPFLALEQDWLTAHDLLRWLHQAKEIMESDEEKKLCGWIAYKALWNHLPDHQQYGDDGLHVVCANPTLAPLFSEWRGNLELPIFQSSKVEEKTEEEFSKEKSERILFEIPSEHILEEKMEEKTEDPLYCFLAEPLNEFYSKHLNVERKIMTDLGKNLSIISRTRSLRRLLIYEKIDLLLRVRVYKKPAEYCDATMIPKLVRADWIERFVFRSELATSLWERSEYLQRVAPHYWEKIHPLYQKVLIRLAEEHGYDRLSSEQLLQLKRWFPEVFPEKFFSYSTLPFRMAWMPLPQAAYLLGIPFHLSGVDQEMVSRVLDLWNAEGEETYLQRIFAYNRNFHPSLPSEMGGEERWEFKNEANVLGDELESFSPFDLVYHVVGKHIFRFTRSEFPSILKTGKNPWTNEPLPPWVLHEMMGRCQAADQYKLPPSIPLKELYERCLEGKEWEDSEGQEEDSKKETPVPPWEEGDIDGLICLLHSINHTLAPASTSPLDELRQYLNPSGRRTFRTDSRRLRSTEEDLPTPSMISFSSWQWPSESEGETSFRTDSRRENGGENPPSLEE